MTKSEKKCKDISDVCELAHSRTVRHIRKLNKTYGLHHKINCEGIMDCTDGGQIHDKKDPDYCTHYGAKAQEIFNDHYDHITNVTGL